MEKLTASWPDGQAGLAVDLSRRRRGEMLPWTSASEEEQTCNHIIIPSPRVSILHHKKLNFFKSSHTTSVTVQVLASWRHDHLQAASNTKMNIKAHLLRFLQSQLYDLCCRQVAKTKSTRIQTGSELVCSSLLRSFSFQFLVVFF